MAYKIIARIIEGVKENENITIECDEVTQERFNQLHQILKNMFEEKYNDFQCTKCEINIFDDDRLIMNYRPDKYNYENQFINSFNKELVESLNDEKVNKYLQEYRKKIIDESYLLPIQKTYPIKEFERKNQEEIRCYEDIYSYLKTILDITEFDIEFNQLNETYNLIDQQGAYLGGQDTYRNITSLENIIDRLDIYINDTFIRSLEDILTNIPDINLKNSNYDEIVKCAKDGIKNKIISKDYEYDVEIINFITRIGDYKEQLENKEKINDFFQLYDKEKDACKKQGYEQEEDEEDEGLEI